MSIDVDTPATARSDEAEDSDQRRPLAELFRDLRTSPAGLTGREAARRLTVYGPNQLTRRGGPSWPGELLEQFTQPLVLLLGVAAVLAWVGGTPALSLAVLAVIVLNAAFAFVQQRQAERAVNALASFLPPTARVVRDGTRREIEAADLVPGDVLVVAEGDRVCADARIVDELLVVDLSALTGESVPTTRSADPAPVIGPLLEAPDLLFSGTTCTGGEAAAVVTRTGMHTELGRIAALSQRGRSRPSPLERQVRRVTWIIAAVAVAVGAAFVPVGLAAGLGWAAAITFSTGLIVANVPEGLLPTITLALASGVRQLARRGAVVKRLSAVETLGSVTVICTDKTGTLTENRMRVTRLWLAGTEVDATAAVDDPRARILASSAAACTTADAPGDAQPAGTGDPTELALLRLAADLGVGVSSTGRSAARRAVFHFDAHLTRMSTVDAERVGTVAVHRKGAPEAVLPRCTQVLGRDGHAVPIDDTLRGELQQTLDFYAAAGLRVLAVARRDLGPARAVPTDRASVESDLVLVGLVAMVDPPRTAVPDAVARAHRAGIRIHVVTGDYGPTAAEIARKVGIGAGSRRIVNGDALDRLGDADLDALLARDEEIVFARTSPEAKLRICEALQAGGAIVAMTGDGVNDAPALRHADVGVAMGRSGTDVAREAATMVLTDDDFATIVAAIAAGRQVFDNVRKFVLYIFAHAVPEVVPFIVFALTGGAVPLPLTVLQILAIDLGTETLPALALGREPAEPGAMDRPPRPRGAGVVDRSMLLRAWLLLGSVSAVLVMGGFLFTLVTAGWVPGAPTGAGTALHEAYLQATTITFAGIVACQIGTAFAARTDRASLFSVGVTSNPLLLWGIAFEVAFTAAVIYVPWLQDVFGTAALTPAQLIVILPFPFVVWGADARPLGPTEADMTTATTVRHPVVTFTVIAYAISWLCWLPLLADRQDLVGWSASTYLHLLGGLGPAAAALVVTAAVAGRAGVADLLRRAVAWRGRLRWIALAVLGPLGLFAVAVVVARMVEGAWPDLARFGASTEYPALPLVVFWVANLLFYGFGEEIGWRGFAQPTLQRRRSPLTAALIVSLIWTAWHLPLFGITATYRAMPAIGFVGFFLSMVAASLVLAWLYLRSRGSILVVAVFHAVFDIATTTPTTTTVIPTVMGAVITVAALAVIPSLRREIMAERP